MKRLSSIQILRAAAALSVALFHACQWSQADFAVGAAGVDLFFLISGFVLWLAAERAPVSPGAFLWARFTRVAPLYWIWTLIAAAMAAVWPPITAIIHLGLGHLLLSLAFLPHTDPAGGPWPLLPSGWTLVYEAFFYLAFADRVHAMQAIDRPGMTRGRRRARVKQQIIPCGAIVIELKRAVNAPFLEGEVFARLHSRIDMLRQPGVESIQIVLSSQATPSPVEPAHSGMEA